MIWHHFGLLVTQVEEVAHDLGFTHLLYSLCKGKLHIDSQVFRFKLLMFLYLFYIFA